jgi:hypothetical protein
MAASEGTARSPPRPSEKAFQPLCLPVGAGRAKLLQHRDLLVRRDWAFRQDIVDIPAWFELDSVSEAVKELGGSSADLTAPSRIIFDAMHFNERHAITRPVVTLGDETEIGKVRVLLA